MTEQRESDYIVRKQGDLVPNEADQAKDYWADIGVRDFYAKEQPWADFMAMRTLAFSPQSVFEFGCNIGRNLMSLTKSAPDISVSGLDINRDAIRIGAQQGLRLAVGDEDNLKTYPDRAFDVVFTVSVLDHLPNPAPVLKSLCRIAGQAVLLLEPWLGEEGKVVRNRDRNSGEMIDTTPYSYSWNYPRLRSQVAPEWGMTTEPFRLESNLGRYYELYTLERPLA